MSEHGDRFFTFLARLDKEYGTFKQHFDALVAENSTLRCQLAERTTLDKSILLENDGSTSSCPRCSGSENPFHFFTPSVQPICALDWQRNQTCGASSERFSQNWLGDHVHMARERKQDVFQNSCAECTERHEGTNPFEVAELREEKEENPVLAHKSCYTTSSSLMAGNKAGGDGLVGGVMVQSMSSRNSAESPDTSHLKQRLRARLGHAHNSRDVTAELLHQAVTALGLSKYSVEDMAQVISALAAKRNIESSTPRLHKGHSARFSKQAKSLERMSQIRHVPWLKSQLTFKPSGEAPEDESISFRLFADHLLNVDYAQHMHPDVQIKAQTVREVLLSGDTNRVVAELANVHVDDLASPPPSLDLMSNLESLVSLIIFINLIIVHVQTDSANEAWVGWLYFEIFFVVFYGFESILRCTYVGCRTFCTGPDWCWNLFDISVLLVAVFDVITHVFAVTWEGTSLTVLRMIRLTRLTRMLRMFRFRALKELTLMVKGLICGFKTLFWSMVLLIVTIWIIAAFATGLLGRGPSTGSTILDMHGLFSSIPRSMFTIFRCFSGDCSDDAGRSVLMLLTNAFGASFAVPYILCCMLVTFGIFNLITAVYVDNTLEAAKLHHELDKKKKDRESLRVAHITKELLKKFSTANHVFDENNSVSVSGLSKMIRGKQSDDMHVLKMTVSKDLFLLVIQDPEVQTLMDNLDIPPDRAGLFDIFDADCNGSLEVSELVQGLLKVRGEPRKSDMLAALLSVRALQDIVRSGSDRLLQNQQRILQLLTVKDGQAKPQSPSGATSMSF